MDCFEDGSKVACIGITTLVAIGLVIAGMVWSAGTVEPIEYGLKYNTISKSVDNSYVYTGGWYLIGPMSSFISFPATNVNIDFSDFPGA